MFRLFDLPGAAFDEFLDSQFDVIKRQIGDEQAKRRQRDNAHDQQHRHAGKEHLESPGQDNHQCHADIGLQHKNADDHRHKQRGIDPAREILTLAPQCQ